MSQLMQRWSNNYFHFFLLFHSFSISNECYDWYGGHLSKWRGRLREKKLRTSWPLILISEKIICANDQIANVLTFGNAIHREAFRLQNSNYVCTLRDNHPIEKIFEELRHRGERVFVVLQITWSTSAWSWCGARVFASQKSDNYTRLFCMRFTTTQNEQFYRCKQQIVFFFFNFSRVNCSHFCWLSL